MNQQFTLKRNAIFSFAIDIRHWLTLVCVCALLSLAYFFIAPNHFSPISSYIPLRKKNKTLIIFSCASTVLHSHFVFISFFKTYNHNATIDIKLRRSFNCSLCLGYYCAVRAQKRQLHF